MLKKSVIILISIILLASLVLAQDYKLEISTAQEIFKAGENITLKVSLLDSDNKPVRGDVNILIEDAERTKRIEKIIPSNEFVEIDLGEGTTHGYWHVTAFYNEAEATSLFTIEAEESAKFELEGDKLIIVNIGNTKYVKTVQIAIGETTSIKTPKLNVGESISYRLVAPEGTYNIKVTDGKTSLERGNVKLMGTGKAVGVLDESISQRSGITGGISPDEEDEQLLNYLRNNSFIYIFILVIFGAMILLAVERRFRRKVFGK